MIVIWWLVSQVDSKLVDLRENGVKNKSFLDGHVSSVGDIVTNAKRKWQSFCVQAEKEAKDTADYSAAKHCRMEVLLQQRYVLFLLVFLVFYPLVHVLIIHNLIILFIHCSVNTAHSALEQVKRTHEGVNDLGTKHIHATESLIRCVTWLLWLMVLYCYD